jgi:hypothetical protein
MSAKSSRPVVSLASRFRFADFTEASYRKLLRVARDRYAFEFFGSARETPHVLWRHDVDLSVHRALKLAEIEARLGVKSTYFFLLHSNFYNLLEREVARHAHRIVDLGHRAALHFAPDCYPDCRTLDQLNSKLRWEKRVLEDILSTPIRAFSLHDPTPRMLAMFTRGKIAGMTNAYGETLRRDYDYCSDSNGYWRHKRLLDLVKNGEATKLHVLTHPEWWVPSPMSPWRRIKRCVEGRAARMLSGYDEELNQDGRVNVGKKI